MDAAQDPAHPKITYDLITQWSDSFQQSGNVNLENISNSSDAIAALCGKPDSSAFRERADLAKLRAKLSNDQDLSEVAGHQSQLVKDELYKGTDLEHIDFAGMAVRFESWHRDQASLVEDVRKLTANVLTKERSTLERDESNYQLFTEFSYGLYTPRILYHAGRPASRACL